MLWTQRREPLIVSQLWESFTLEVAFEPDPVCVVTKRKCSPAAAREALMAFS